MLITSVASLLFCGVFAPDTGGLQAFGAVWSSRQRDPPFVCVISYHTTAVAPFYEP